MWEVTKMIVFVGQPTLTVAVSTHCCVTYGVGYKHDDGNSVGTIAIPICHIYVGVWAHCDSILSKI